MGRIGKAYPAHVQGRSGYACHRLRPLHQRGPRRASRRWTTFPELLRRADIVTLHCLLTDETRKLIDRERLALMKPTALLINCARGPIVDEAALIEALENGRLAGPVSTSPTPSRSRRTAPF